MDENIILDRLKELRRWQEEQRMMLAKNQLDQQKMLNLEKRKLFQLFGVSGMPDDNSFENDYDSISIQDGVTANQNNNEFPSSHYDVLRFDEKEPRLQPQSKQKIKNLVNTSGNRSKSDEQQHNYSHNGAITKRPFLKRGEGLKNRFKVSPDAFRLNNLPKYKFANKNTRHAQYNQRMNWQQNTNDAKTVYRVNVTNEPDSSEGCPNNAINDTTNQTCKFNLIASDSSAQKYKQEDGSSKGVTPLGEVSCNSNENLNGGLYILLL